MGLKDRFKVMFSWLWEFLGPSIKMYMTEWGRHLATDAFTLVLEASKDNSLSSAAKRKWVFNKLIERIKSRSVYIGVTVKTRFINRVIEEALERLEEIQSEK